MGNVQEDLLTQLAAKCKRENLTIVRERCGIYVVESDSITPVSASANIPCSRDILVELHVDLERKWSALFFVTFYMDSKKKISDDTIKLEVAGNASPSDREAIQAHGEDLWKLLKELIENDL